MEFYIKDPCGDSYLKNYKPLKDSYAKEKRKLLPKTYKEQMIIITKEGWKKLEPIIHTRACPTYKERQFFINIKSLKHLLEITKEIGDVLIEHNDKPTIIINPESYN